MKKNTGKLAWILTAAMAASMVPTFPGVQAAAPTDVVLKGRYETSTPIKVEYKAEDATIQWQSSTDGETWTDISGATGETYTPYRISGTYYVRAAVTADGETVYSSAKLVKPMWIGRRVGNPDGNTGVLGSDKNAITKQIDATGAIASSNPDVIFTVDGEEYLLLDVTEDDNSHFLVMKRKAIGNRHISNSGQLMHEILCWLNDKKEIRAFAYRNGQSGSNGDKSSTAGGASDYTNAGYRADMNSETPQYTAISSALLEHIDENAVWKQEPKCWEWGNLEITYTCGIAIPALTDYENYITKIGWKDFKDSTDTNIVNRMAFRTGSGSNTGIGHATTCYDCVDWNVGVVFDQTSRTVDGDIGLKAVRPMFFLDKDAFKDSNLAEVIDFANAGSDVKTAITASATYDELVEAGYDPDELTPYYEDAGELTAAKLKGQIYETSLPVSVDFTYSGKYNESIKINWYQADTKDGEYKLIGTVLGSQNNFRIPYSAGGKYIKGEAVCPATGTSIMTEAKYVEPKWGPQADVNPLVARNDDGLVTGNNETYPYNEIHSRMPLKTPAEYTFKYGDKEYILLDTTESDESHYLVLTKTPEVKRAFNKTGNGQLFNDLIAWLNNKNEVKSYVEGSEVTTTGFEYEDNGFLSTEYAMPKAIQDHINWNNNWKVERKMWDETNERVYEGGIAIPAYKEIERYAEKIGAYDAGNENIWTRTPLGRKGGDGNSLLAFGTNNEFSGYVYGNFYSKEYYIRPIFYLDKDFFTSVKVENIGSETAALIRKDVPKDKMVASGLYSTEEIESIYKETVQPEEDYINVDFENVKEGGKVSATITTNIQGEDDWTFVAAVYNDGNLIGVELQTATADLDDNGKFSITLPIENIAASDKNTARIFIWDEVMCPIYPLQ